MPLDHRKSPGHGGKEHHRRIVVFLLSKDRSTSFLPVGASLMIFSCEKMIVFRINRYRSTQNSNNDMLDVLFGDDSIAGRGILQTKTILLR
jgi:hypothetical protein